MSVKVRLRGGREATVLSTFPGRLFPMLVLAWFGPNDFELYWVRADGRISTLIDSTLDVMGVAA